VIRDTVSERRDEAGKSSPQSVNAQRTRYMSYEPTLLVPLVRHKQWCVLTYIRIQAAQDRSHSRSPRCSFGARSANNAEWNACDRGFLVRPLGYGSDGEDSRGHQGSSFVPPGTIVIRRPFRRLPSLLPTCMHATQTVRHWPPHRCSQRSHQSSNIHCTHMRSGHPVST
jgi:hypothetical protein